MVQFLSIIFFFLDFFNFCWVFQKFPFFFLCVTLYLKSDRGTQLVKPAVLQTSVEMPLNVRQYRLVFLLTKHVALVFASSLSHNQFLEICSPVDVLSTSKEQKHQGSDF